MRLSLLIATALCVVMAGACSGIVEGDADRPGYRAHTYVATEAEKAYDCPAIAYAIGRSVQAINAMPAKAKAQRDGPPSSMVHAVQRVSGNGIPVLEDYKRERARLKTLGDLSTAKACPAVDVETQIKDATDRLGTFRKDFRGK